MILRFHPQARAEFDRSTDHYSEIQPDLGEAILVTGGAGFLGSHLCERLLARGDKVICPDNYFTGQRSKVAHLQYLRPAYASQ